MATPANEEKLLDYAVQATAQQVDDHCRQLRNVQRENSTADALRLHKQRHLSISSHADGTVTISVELPAETGELVRKALEMAQAELDAEGVDSDEVPSVEEENLFTKQADALLHVVHGFMSGGKEKSNCTADHYQVMVHVDEDALRGEPDENSKSDLPIETVRRLCCDSAVVVVEEDKNGNPMNVGRKHRVVQPALKRALLARDKCCRFPGCSHKKWLDAHHVEHWADGGETSLENTVLLCSKHHRLLHEGNFQIKPGPDGEWHFQNHLRS